MRLLFLHNPRIYLLAAVVIPLLNGCSSSPLARYPDFPARKQRSASAAILSDFVVINGVVGGNLDMVDVPANQKRAKMCLNFLAGALNDKGYHVDRTMLTSMGLLMNREQQYAVVRTAEEQEVDEDSLPTEPAPFFVSRNCANDTTIRKTLRPVYAQLIQIEKPKGDPLPVISEARPLGQAVGGGMIFVLLVGGYNAGITQQHAVFHSPEHFPMNKVAAKQESQVSIRLYAIDSETGEVVWDDHTRKTGGIVHDQKIIDALKEMVDRFP